MVNDENLINQYKRLFIRFHKENGTWDSWRKVFLKKKTFNKVIDACVNTNKYGRAIVFDTFNHKGLTFSIPYSINAAFKGFSNECVYNQRLDLDRFSERERFIQFLKSNLKI